MALADDLTTLISPDTPGDFTLIHKRDFPPFLHMVWEKIDGTRLDLKAKGDKLYLSLAGSPSEDENYNRDHSDVTTLYSGKDIGETGF